MRKSLFGVFVISLGLLACEGDPGTVTSLPQGFNPPPPAAGVVQILGKPFVVEPEQEVVQCVYLDDQIPADLDIQAISSYQMEGGHHVLFMYVTDSYQPESPIHECTEREMVFQRFIGAGGADADRLGVQTPEGIALRVPGKKRFVIQSHYVNSTDQPMTVMDAVYLYPITGPIQHLASMAIHLDDTFELPPGVETTRDSTCHLTEDSNVFQFIGHTHEYGKKFRLAIEHADGSAETIYENLDVTPDFRSNPQIRVWPKESPLVLKSGEKMHLHCEWNNTTPEKIRFPKEMCAGAFYYYPSRGFEVCNQDGGMFHIEQDQ